MRAATTVAALAVLLLSLPALAAPCDGFVDVDTANDTYCTAVTHLKDHGISVGCSDSSHFCPGDYVTRLQMALFLRRAALSDPTNSLGDHTNMIGGGTVNVANGAYDVVCGGTNNIAVGSFSVVCGGGSHYASGVASTVLGGTFNTVTANFATAIGGGSNIASGDRSFVAGVAAIASAEGQFVWSGGGLGFNPATVTGHWADATETFNVKATGGTWIVSGVDAENNPNAGVRLTAGSGSWANASDRAIKRDFEAVDAREVLARVAALPIDSWSYIAEGSAIRHIGPVAQDFHAAFGLGPDDKSITSVDEAGVALAAIKGLHAQYREAIAKKDAELADLRVRLDSLERAIAR